MNIYLVKTKDEKTNKEYFFFADLIGVVNEVLVATFQNENYPLIDHKLHRLELIDVDPLSTIFNAEYLEKIVEVQNA